MTTTVDGAGHPAGAVATIPDHPPTTTDHPPTTPATTPATTPGRRPARWPLLGLIDDGGR